MSRRQNADAGLRQHVLDTALTMSSQGLSPGRSGNVSARHRKGMLITPSGMAYQELKPADIVHVLATGKPAANQLKPSSEWRLHRAIYKARPDVQAIVHAHSLNATALACAEAPIPAFHYMVAMAGGSDIPLVPYATFGGEELAQAAAATLSNRNACLLAHHGQIAVGDSLGAALDLAAEVETLSAQYIKVLTLGAVRLLDEAEMEKVLIQFRSYGRSAQRKKTAPAGAPPKTRTV
jgi:L-fuculose-phosphate aldolase